MRPQIRNEPWTVVLTMYGAGRRRSESHPFSKRANMCADHGRTLDACGVATPYKRRCKLVPTAAVLARAHATYRSRFRGAYAPHRSRAMPPYRPSTAKSSASRTDSNDPLDPPTVRGLERGASRSSGQPDSTHGRWTVRAPRVASFVTLGETRRRAPLNDAIAHGTSA